MNFDWKGFPPHGAFFNEAKDQTGDQTSKTGSNYNSGWLQFSANKDNESYGNPMAGHAAGSDIHPANIALLPVIFY